MLVFIAMSVTQVLPILRGMVVMASVPRHVNAKNFCPTIGRWFPHEETKYSETRFGNRKIFVRTPMVQRELLERLKRANIEFYTYTPKESKRHFLLLRGVDFRELFHQRR